jgi:hypothetical protein
VKKAYIDNLSEENHENLRAVKGSCVHWHVKEAYIDNPF